MAVTALPDSESHDGSNIISISEEIQIGELIGSPSETRSALQEMLFSKYQSVFEKASRKFNIIEEARSHTIEVLKKERQKIHRTVGETYLLTQFGIPKGIFALSMLKYQPDEVQAIANSYDEAKIKKISERVSPGFENQAIIEQAANDLAMIELENLGIEQSQSNDEFAMELYERAKNLSNKQTAQKDYNNLFLDGNKLAVQDERPAIQGFDKEFWYTLPIVPLTMKFDKKAQIKENNSPENIAHNIMCLLENNQISNHGSHVSISPEARRKMIETMANRVAQGLPVQLDLYYTLGRMTNPMETTTSSPSLQEWAMFYKLAQVSETAKVFYQPENSPTIEWIIIDEGQAFGPAWDMSPEETTAFRDELSTMLESMGATDYFKFDDLKRMADECPESWQMFEELYTKMKSSWENFIQIADAEDINNMDDYVTTLKTVAQTIPDGEMKSDVEGILTIYRSISRVVNPTKHIEGITYTDLVNIYRSIAVEMRRIDQVQHPLTETAKSREVLEKLKELTLEGVLVHKALMGSRSKMVKRYPESLSVSITDKNDKLPILTGDSRTKIFPSHGEAVMRLAGPQSIGQAEVPRPWVDVMRMPHILSNPNMIPVLDPKTGEPYYFVEL